MKKNFSLLILGDIYNPHIYRFVKYLKLENPQCHIEIFSLEKRDDILQELDNDYLSYFDDYYIFSLSRKFGKIPGLRQLETIINWKKFFCKYTQSKHYDIVNVHTPTCLYYFLLNKLKKVSTKLVITPWGSDVYRVTGREKYMVQKIYNSADYVTGGGDRFTHDFMRIFNVPQKKFGYAEIGSETLDYIMEHKNTIDANKAKEELGIGGHYAITCAYSASTAQRHFVMIDAIKRIESELPSNFYLIFPLSYPKASEYVECIKNKVNECGLNAIYIEDFLDLKSLFILRQATDMFIHIQTTDANCTTLREYLLCGKKVINGAWLRYDELEADGQHPYFVADNLDKLDETILHAYLSEPLPLPLKTRMVIESMGCKKAAVNWNKFFTSIS